MNCCEMIGNARPVKTRRRWTLGFSAIHWLAGSVSDICDLYAYVSRRYSHFDISVSTIDSSFRQEPLKGSGIVPLHEIARRARPMLKTGNLIWRDWRVLLPRLAQTGSVTPFAHINMVLLGD